MFAVLACQVTGLAAVPLVLGQRAASAPAGGDEGDEIACSCTHGPNAECPMHKHKKPAPASGDARWCSGCPDAQDIVLTTVVGFAGALVDRYQPVAPEGVSESIGVLRERSLDLVRPPTSPPPRA